MSRRDLPKFDLSNISLTLPSNKSRSFTPSPLPSPPHSPLSTYSPSGYLEKIKQTLDFAVSKRGTKASNTSIDGYVKDLCNDYSMLVPSEKQEFLLYMAKHSSTNHNTILELIKKIPSVEYSDNCAASFDLEALIRWEDKLRQCLQPQYHWLATQISRIPGGVKFIIDLRADVLDLISSGQAIERESLTELKDVDANLRDLLSLWFTVGMLDLQRITWESPCDILQKISEYEAVHPVRNWTDLKKRVGNYRRCFIFTHSCIPNEPLVVLHTFLTFEISNSMNKIVQIPRSFSIVDEASLKAGENSSLITTVIFYSITSTQKGLKGIELGNYLIKRVVSELKDELPNLTKFSSLSPVPGFMKWLQQHVTRAQKGEFHLFTESELKTLMEIFCMTESYEIYAEFRRLLLANGWVRDDTLKRFCELPMMRMCAYYLYSEKRRGLAFDPVANFHLRNGAVMWRLNWNADLTPRGLDNSGGIMINYRYFIEDCETNTKNYLEEYKIKASENIVFLAKSAENLLNKTI